MTIQLERSIVTSGTSGVVFDNNAGLLRINEMGVTDVTTAALVSTANNGVSFLSGVKISRKSMVHQCCRFFSISDLRLVLSSGRCQFRHLYNDRWLTDCHQFHRDPHDAHGRCLLRRRNGQHPVAGERHHRAEPDSIRPLDGDFGTDGSHCSDLSVDHCRQYWGRVWCERIWCYCKHTGLFHSAQRRNCTYPRFTDIEPHT